MSMLKVFFFLFQKEEAQNALISNNMNFENALGECHCSSVFLNCYQGILSFAYFDVKSRSTATCAFVWTITMIIFITGDVCVYDN